MKPKSASALQGHLTDRDIALLLDVERFRLLTTRQIQRLHFPSAPLGPHISMSSATRTTTRVLGRLEEHGAIGRLQRRIGGIKHGSSLTIWQLGPAGDRFLRARRGDPLRRRYDEPGLTFIDHQLAVAETAVGLIEQAKVGRFDLLELELEPACWREFNSIGNSVVSLKPDLMAVTADTNTETHSFVELDRGTEHVPAVVRKCRIYQRYYDTGIEQQHRGLFPAVVWIVPDAVRAKKLRDAINAESALSSDLFSVVTPQLADRQLAPYEQPLPNRKEV